MGVVTKYGFLRSGSVVANPRRSSPRLACLQGEHIHDMLEGLIYFEVRKRARTSTSNIFMKLVCRAKGPRSLWKICRMIGGGPSSLERLPNTNLGIRNVVAQLFERLDTIHIVPFLTNA